MTLWRTLRNALALASEVEQLRAEVRTLQSEWTDVLDKLTAREERIRKRMAAALKAGVDGGLSSVEADRGAGAGKVADSGGAKVALYRRAAALRARAAGRADRTAEG